MKHAHAPSGNLLPNPSLNRRIAACRNAPVSLRPGIALFIDRHIPVLRDIYFHWAITRSWYVILGGQAGLVFGVLAAIDPRESESGQVRFQKAR